MRDPWASLAGTRLHGGDGGWGVCCVSAVTVVIAAVVTVAGAAVTVSSCPLKLCTLWVRETGLKPLSGVSMAGGDP